MGLDARIMAGTDRHLKRRSGFAAYPRFITVSSCPRGCLGLSFERCDVAPLPDGCVPMFSTARGTEPV